ncbi:MAG: (Fe-S)-binding protein, partial [Planctomycetota bacterium]
MTTLGYPTTRVKNWKEVAIKKLGELLEKRRSLRLYLDICVKCGACADKCQFFLGTGDPKNMPVARAELLRKVYKRYFTWTGRIFGRLAGAEDLTEEVLEEWYTYFYQCSECRRCSVYCPYGIDTAEITMAAREIMTEIGVASKYWSEVVAKVYETGNNLGIPAPAWKDSCEFLEEEIKEETGVDVRLPVDEKGAEVLLVPPSADLFVNDETMIGYAKVFHAAGVSWTTSTYASEHANYGMFNTYRDMKKINKRILDAARELGVKKIIWSECGHAWRAALFTTTLNGPMDFLEVPYPIHICQFTADLIKRGALKLD